MRCGCNGGSCSEVAAGSRLPEAPPATLLHEPLFATRLPSSRTHQIHSLSVLFRVHFRVLVCWGWECWGLTHNVYSAGVLMHKPLQLGADCSRQQHRLTGVLHQHTEAPTQNVWAGCCWLMAMSIHPTLHHCGKNMSVCWVLHIDRVGFL